PPLALEHLADRFAPDCRLDGVLDVRNVNTKPVRLSAIYVKIDVGLSEHPEDAEILDPPNVAHHGHDFVRLLLQHLQVRAVDFDGQLALDAADGFFHVV